MRLVIKLFLGTIILPLATVGYFQATRTELDIKVDEYIERFTYVTRLAVDEGKIFKIFTLKHKINDLISDTKLIAEKDPSQVNKIEKLEEYTQKCKGYCSVAVFGIDGKLVRKSGIEQSPESDELMERNFIKAVIEHRRLEISTEHDSIYGGHTYFIVGVPLLNRKGEVTGIVRSSLDLDAQLGEWSY